MLDAQVDEVLGDRSPTLEDIRALGFTTRCLNEAMRLYPQPPVLIRRALADDMVGGYRVGRSCLSRDHRLRCVHIALYPHLLVLMWRALFCNIVDEIGWPFSKSNCVIALLGDIRADCNPKAIPCNLQSRRCTRTHLSSSESGTCTGALGPSEELQSTYSHL